MLASLLARLAQPGTVIALDGDLGAGKTTFSQAFARAIGVTEVVNSPTFVLIKEYSSGRLPLYHMDAYRISAAEAGELGLEEYFDGNGVSLVEWAERIEADLPACRLALRIEGSGDDARVFRMKPYGEPYVEWCRQFERMGAVTS